MTIRPADPADVPAIAAIYNAGIASGLATFETRPRSPDEVAVTAYSDRCVCAGVGE